MFTRQHYKAIAYKINGATHYTSLSHLGDIAPTIDKTHLVNTLADYFAKDNPLFSRQKFFKACGLKNK